MKLSTIICTAYSYSFSDGSTVTWSPLSVLAKGHDKYSVLFNMADGRSITKEITGPASSASSLHHLKNIYKYD